MVNAQHQENVQVAREIDFDADTLHARFVGHDLSAQTLDSKVDKYIDFLEESAKKMGIAQDLSQVSSLS